MHSGLSGIFLFNLCYPGIAIHSTLFYSPKCLIWTRDYMTTLVITHVTSAPDPAPEWESSATKVLVTSRFHVVLGKQAGVGLFFLVF